MTTPSVKARMPNSVRPALVGGWGQAEPSVLIAGALLLSGVLGLLQGSGVSVLPGSVFALAVLRGFSSVEARNWFAR
ncbi:hypothetical protein [Streptomyces canus]|uniref:hypothetical protein n=1 Tax=Streptomyces canus TaxID=58343 RepID=UPI002E3609F0|nr:hypothetical protein [Streptomyces canus]